MKVLVTGASGQLGVDVVDIFKQNGHLVLGCDKNQLDITNLEVCQKVITSFYPDIIIHCAAYTSVDKAETDIDNAYSVNAIGSRNIAVSAQKIKAKLIYISTDYVFDGKGISAYYEYDQTNPQSIYGKSKLAGERLVQTLCERYFIVRTSWVYGLHGNNFVKTILKLGQERDELKVVNDQKGSPTYTIDLAHFLNELAITEKYGIYHASNSGVCTWYEFAEYILKYAKEQKNIPIRATIEPCKTEEFPRPAPRPNNSTLENMAIRINNLKPIRHWHDAIEAFFQGFPDCS